MIMSHVARCTSQSSLTDWFSFVSTHHIGLLIVEGVPALLEANGHWSLAIGLHEADNWGELVKVQVEHNPPWRILYLPSLWVLRACTAFTQIYSSFRTLRSTNQYSACSGFGQSCIALSRPLWSRPLDPSPRFVCWNLLPHFLLLKINHRKITPYNFCSN